MVTRRAFALGLAASGSWTLSAHASSLDAELQREQRAGFAGAVAVSSGERRYEWASDGAEARETAYWIASVSKAVTATAAVRLAQQGLLDLESDVRSVFPFVEGPLAAKTLRQLLAHRAGLGHNYAADGIADREAAVRAIAARGIEKDGFFYSNDGYSLAAAMIEEKTNASFESVLHEQVFEPAGMSRSGVWGEPAPNAMAPYRRRRGSAMMDANGPVRNYGQLGPSGVWSTAGDLLNFLAAVNSDSFLSAGSRALLWTPGWVRAPGGAPRSGTSYGLGWALEVEDDIVKSAYHGGNEDWLRHNAQIKTSEHLKAAIVSNAGDLGDQSWSQRVLNVIERAWTAP